MRKLINACAAFVTGAVLVLAVVPQSNAAVWAWGCLGSMGDNDIVMHRYWLVVVPAKSLPLKLDDVVRYNAEDVNSGFEQTMTFTRDDKSGRPLLLTEKSSRKISHKEGRVGPRDQTRTIFKKIYRYAPSDGPARDVAMQCIEYILSTTGGRR